MIIKKSPLDEEHTSRGNFNVRSYQHISNYENENYIYKDFSYSQICSKNIAVKLKLIQFKNYKNITADLHLHNYQK